MKRQLTTARLRLRPFEMGDLDALVPIYGDPEVMAIRKLGVQNPGQTKAELAVIVEHWRRHAFGLWAVFDNVVGGLLGECGLRYRKEGDVEISYGLAKQAWGQGLATEASLAVLDHGFRDIGLEEVVAIAKASNLRSHRVMIKLGMKLDHTWQRDGIDRVHYVIRASDYLARQDEETPPV